MIIEKDKALVGPAARLAQVLVAEIWSGVTDAGEPETSLPVLAFPTEFSAMSGL
jgi:hypothetical protein